MNTIHQISFVTKEIRHKLIEDGKPYLKMFQKDKQRQAYLVRNEWLKRNLKRQLGIAEILYHSSSLPNSCLCKKCERDRVSPFSKAYAYGKHMGFQIQLVLDLNPNSAVFKECGLENYFNSQTLVSAPAKME